MWASSGEVLLSLSLLRCCAQSMRCSGGLHGRHVDCSGHEFPFSRGCSFYEVGSDGLITAARDCVEPALKPGSSALYVRSCAAAR